MPESLPVPGGSQPDPSYLFTVRVWREDLGNGHVEWRGKVQHVTSGEAYYFRDWPGLIACLQRTLENQPG